jgi:hypothetical protein
MSPGIAHLNELFVVEFDGFEYGVCMAYVSGMSEVEFKLLCRKNKPGMMPEMILS